MRIRGSVDESMLGRHLLDILLSLQKGTKSVEGERFLSNPALPFIHSSVPLRENAHNRRRRGVERDCSIR